MKVFILGAKGFIGSAFVRYCQAKKIQFAAIEKDNYKDYVGQSCDIFINANGNSKKYIAEKYPQRDFKLSFLSVEKTLRDFGIKKYICISSIDVYNNFSDPKENHEDSDINVSKQSFYGFHKYLAEQMIKKYAQDWLVIRCGGFVGKGLKKNSIFDILNSLPLRIHVASQYQYLPVDELPKIVFFLIRKKFSKEVFNACGKGLISLKEVIKLVQSYKLKCNSKNSKKEIYNINIRKIYSFFRLPSTKESVKAFIKDSPTGVLYRRDFNR